MKIKSRTEILDDIINESEKHPKGWKAAFGRDDFLLSDDFYIFNPNSGLYLLKEYRKNPYEIKGIGSKIARNIDDDIEVKIKNQSGNFGIIQGNIQKILKNLENGIKPSKIFEEGIKGNDLGIRIPLKGKAFSSKESFNYIRNSYSDKQKSIDQKFEKLLDKDGVYDSYR